MQKYTSKGITITLPWTGVQPSDVSPHVPEGARVFVEFNWGRWMRPVLKPKYWLDKSVNPWFQLDPEKVWFTIDIPFAGPLIGFVWNGDGKYFGFKRLGLWHQEYSTWTKAPLGNDRSAITFSARG